MASREHLYYGWVVVGVPGGGSKLAPASQQERLQLFVEGPGSLVVWQ
jgi:hypothetical protein